MRWTVLTLAWLAGCTWISADEHAERTLDADGDGALASVDCDDEDPAVHPGADEACNEVDDDCDGETDEDPPLVYDDLDHDGYGDPATAAALCPAPSDTVSDGTDCDDLDGDIHPAAEEHCNQEDDDCDGQIDEDPPTWFSDADGDGYGGLRRVPPPAIRPAAAWPTARTATTGTPASTRTRKSAATRWTRTAMAWPTTTPSTSPSGTPTRTGTPTAPGATTPWPASRPMA